jgi:hypothetical protein
MSHPALSPEVIDQWNAYLAEEQQDTAFISRQANIDRLRLVSRKGLLGLLEDYQSGKISNESFRNTFDHKTRKEWDQFGLAGMNGAMFLNMLVKHIDDQEQLTQQLQTALRLPQSIEEGWQKMQAFLDYLNSLIQTGKATRRELQPARVTFFLSSWWHQQDPPNWPPCYGTATRVLEREGLYAQSANLIRNYFEFRRIFRELAAALKLNVWDFEHLCVWLDQTRNTPPMQPTRPAITRLPASPPIKTSSPPVSQAIIAPLMQTPSTPAPASNVPVEETIEPDGQTEKASSVHAQVQWVLAKMGIKFGLKVWIAQNDRTKTYNGETLGSLSISEMPLLGMDTQSQRTIQLIDVVWLRGNNQIAAAFEVEYTTSVYSGLLRMSDLSILAPNLTFPLYIVIPQERVSLVQRELSRPTFQFIELHQRCSYLTIEDLLKEKDAIKKWAKDPSVIDHLAYKVANIIE